MVWAVILSALLVFVANPQMAYAEPDTEGVEQSDESDSGNVGTVDVSGVVDSVDNLHTDLVGLETAQNVMLQTIIDQTKPEEKTEGDKDELDYLISIDSKLDTIASEPVREIQAQEALAAVSVNSFVAYANVATNNTYASYAIGMLPRVGYGEHYCFVQDTSSSYVFVWGDLELRDARTIAGSDVNWVRWYYGGNTIGNVTEYGSGNVTVSAGQHVISSDLGNWPMLPESADTIRKELGFYACVAVVLWSLAAVWRFTLRMRNGVAD